MPFAVDALVDTPDQAALVLAGMSVLLGIFVVIAGLAVVPHPGLTPRLRRSLVTDAADRLDRRPDRHVRAVPTTPALRGVDLRRRGWRGRRHRRPERGRQDDPGADPQRRHPAPAPGGHQRHGRRGGQGPDDDAGAGDGADRRDGVRQPRVPAEPGDRRRGGRARPRGPGGAVRRDAGRIDAR